MSHTILVAGRSLSLRLWAPSVDSPNYHVRLEAGRDSVSWSVAPDDLPALLNEVEGFAAAIRRALYPESDPAAEKAFRASVEHEARS